MSKFELARTDIDLLIQHLSAIEGSDDADDNRIRAAKYLARRLKAHLEELSPEPTAWAVVYISEARKPLIRSQHQSREPLIRSQHQSRELAIMAARNAKRSKLYADQGVTYGVRPIYPRRLGEIELV